MFSKMLLAWALVFTLGTALRAIADSGDSNLLPQFACLENFNQVFPSSGPMNGESHFGLRPSLLELTPDGKIIAITAHGGLQLDLERWSKEILNSPTPVDEKLRRAAADWKEKRNFYGALKTENGAQWLRIQSGESKVRSVRGTTYARKLPQPPDQPDAPPRFEMLPLYKAPNIDLTSQASKLSAQEVQPYFSAEVNKRLDSVIREFYAESEARSFEYEMPEKDSYRRALAACEKVPDPAIQKKLSSVRSLIETITPESMTGIDGYATCLSELLPFTQGGEFRVDPYYRGPVGSQDTDAILLEPVDGGNYLALALGNQFRSQLPDKDHGHLYSLPPLHAGMNHLQLRVTDGTNVQEQKTVPAFLLSVDLHFNPKTRHAKVISAGLPKPAEEAVLVEPRLTEPGQLLWMRKRLKDSVVSRLKTMATEIPSDPSRAQTALDVCRRMTIDPEIKALAEKAQRSLSARNHSHGRSASGSSH